MKRLLTALAMAAALGVPATAIATPKHCPPGHAKKGWCTPGQRYVIPGGVRYERIDDYDRYGLRAPGRGRTYGVVDGEVFLILEATREVLEAVGAVSTVLNNN